MEYNVKTEEQSLDMSVCWQACAVMLPQPPINLELKGLEKDIVHIYENPKCAALQHAAWLPVHLCPMFYFEAFTLFASFFSCDWGKLCSFKVNVKDGFVLLSEWGCRTESKLVSLDVWLKTSWLEELIPAESKTESPILSFRICYFPYSLKIKFLLS